MATYGSTTAPTQGKTSLWQPPTPLSHPRPDGNPDSQLRSLPAIRDSLVEAKRPGDRRRVAGNLPHRELRQNAPLGVCPLRVGQAPLRAGRVPAIAPDLRAAVQGLAPLDQGAAHRGGSLSRRHPHHARRRRVHHQRGRAGGRQPVPPQPRRGLRQRDGGHRRTEAAKLPHHPRTRQLDRAERQPQGKPLGPHRPERQVLDHDAVAGDGPAVQRQRQSAARLLSRPRSSRSPTAAAPRRSKANWPSATSSIRPTARGPAKSSSSARRRSRRTPPKRSAPPA